MTGLGAFSLRARIILLGLILVVPLVLVFVIRSEGEAEREFAEARGRATLLVQRANGDYSDLLLKAQTAIDVVAKSPLATGSDTAACDSFVDSLRSGYTWANTLFVTDPAGNKICATSGESKPQNVAGGDWFRRVITTKQPVVSDYLIGIASHRPQIDAAQPIVDAQGRVVRVVAIGIDLAAFNAQLAGEAAYPGASVTVLDAEGTVLGHYPDRGDVVGKRFPNEGFVAEVLRSRSGATEADGIDGTRRFFAFEPFGGTSLTIAIGIAKQPIADKIDGQLRHDLAILGAVVIACILGALVGADRLILRPLGRLGSAAVAIGEGRYADAHGLSGGAPELSGTLRAIDEMAQLLERRERELKASEARYRMLAENTTDMIFLLSADGRQTYVSPACLRLLGYTPEQLMALTSEDFVHPDDAPAISEKFARLSPEEPEFTSAHRLRRKDGAYIWVEAVVRLIPDALDPDASIIATARDISARRRAEETLRESESRYRTLADNATDLIVLQDLALRPLYISPASERLLGYAPDDMMGLTAHSLVHPDDAESFTDAVKSLSREAPRARRTHRLLRRDGSYVWVEASLQLIPADGDDPARILTVMRDITERKQAEDAANDLRQLLSDAIDAMQDGIAVYDADDRLVLSNSALSAHRVDGQDIFTPGSSYEDIIRVFWRALRGGKGDFEDYVQTGLARHRQGDGYPWELQDKDGNWHLTRHFRTRDGGILTVSTDITALKKAEAEAVRAEELVIDAIEAMQDAISLYDADEQLVLANRALMQRIPTFALLLDEATKYEDVLRGFWHSGADGADHEAYEEFVAKRLEHFRRADGTPFETEAEDGEWFVSRHFRTRDGGTISVSTNVTVAKRAAVEIEAARDAAEAANHAKSAFLASMSHEIRTPMNGVLGFADLLLDTDLSTVQRRHLRGIQEAGRSLLALINDILDLSKIEAGKLEVERVPINPDAIVDGAVSILRSQFVAKAVDLRVAHAANVPVWVEGDPTRVRQILLNLMSNALKFTDHGHVIVRSSFVRGENGDLLRFEVEDTGIGIPADRQHLLFQEFSQIDRSTTRRFGGTGLGLAICKRLSEAMGGEIGVTSQPGVGSTFWFTIAATRTTAPAASGPTPVGAGERPSRILVAEDLPMNQMVIDGYLRGAGHDIAFAANGAEAVAALEAEPFDLVLMDVEMPGMDGLEATRAIRALDGPMRDVPIVALTANALLEDAAECKEAGMNDFLSKPVDRAALNAMIAKWARVPDPQDGDTAPIRVRAQVLDPAIMDELESLLGKEKAAEFVDISRSALVAMVPTFVAWSDETEMAHEAHKLISIAGNIGCLELVQLSREMSTLNGEAVGNRAMRDKMVAALERAMAALEVRFPAA